MKLNKRFITTCFAAAAGVAAIGGLATQAFAERTVAQATRAAQQAATAQTAANMALARASEPVSGRIIVRYKDHAVRTASGTSAYKTMGAQAAAATSKALLTSTAQFAPKAGLIYTKNVSPLMAVVKAQSLAQSVTQNTVTRASLQAVVDQIKLDPNVQYAEIDERVRAFAAPSDADFATKQWNLKAPAEVLGGANLPLAWDRATGAGVTIAILDTGIRPHAEFSGRILPGFDFVSSTYRSNDGDGWDADASDPGDGYGVGYCSDDPSSEDYVASSSTWHGTHVAGIAAAGAGNGGVAGKGDMVGVAHGAKILPVRVLGKCGGDLSDILVAMQWSAGLAVSGIPVNANPAKILNMSLGSDDACSTATQETVNAVTAAGAVVVAATGNSGLSSTIGTPAGCAGVIAVTAHSSDGTSPNYANIGAGTSISAPGGNGGVNGVYSTFNDGALAPGADSYSLLSGTSMATPHVAGVAAMLLQLKPDASPARLKAAVQAGARSFVSPFYCFSNAPKCGSGWLDANGALDKINTSFPPSMKPIAAQRTTTGQALTFTVSAENLGTGTLQYSAPSLPSGASINAGTGVFTWPSPATAGTYRIAFQASNDQGISEAVQVTVTVTQATTTTPTTPTTTTTDSGGGGCTVGNPNQRDGSLVLLGLLAMAALWVRRKKV